VDGERVWQLTGGRKPVSPEDMRELYRRMEDFERSLRLASAKLADVRELLFWAGAMLDTPRCKGESKRVAAAAIRQAKAEYDEANAQLAGGAKYQAIKHAHMAALRLARGALELARNCAEGQVSLLFPSDLPVGELSAPPTAAPRLRTRSPRNAARASGEPRRYLSKVDATRFRVIDKSMPEIADTTLERAVAQFRKFDTTTEDIPVWDGAAGRFTTLSALPPATDAGPRADEPEPEEATTLDDLVRIAADRVEDLRGIDVYRVLDIARQRQHREPALLDRMIEELGARRSDPDFLSYLVEAAAELDEEHGTRSLVTALRHAHKRGGRVYDKVVALVKERHPELAPTLNSVHPRQIVAETMGRRR